jgi:hypothetical protein
MNIIYVVCTECQNQITSSRDSLIPGGYNSVMVKIGSNVQCPHCGIIHFPGTILSVVPAMEVQL